MKEYIQNTQLKNVWYAIALQLQLEMNLVINAMKN